MILLVNILSDFLIKDKWSFCELLMTLMSRKLSKLTYIRRMKSQNNIIFWYTHLQQLGGNSNFSAIILNPNFTIDSIEMQTTSMRPTITAPTSMQALNSDRTQHTIAQMN
jgi:hypothetical protein